MKLQRRLLRKRKRIPNRSECYSLFEIVLIASFSFAIDNTLNGIGREIWRNRGKWDVDVISCDNVIV